MPVMIGLCLSATMQAYGCLGSSRESRLAAKKRYWHGGCTKKYMMPRDRVRGEESQDVARLMPSCHTDDQPLAARHQAQQLQSKSDVYDLNQEDVEETPCQNRHSCCGFVTSAVGKQTTLHRRQSGVASHQLAEVAQHTCNPSVCILLTGAQFVMVPDPVGHMLLPAEIPRNQVDNNVSFPV